MNNINERIAHRLIQKKKTLAIAESCTGGLVAHGLTNVPGASSFLRGGIVAYANETKTKLLKVPTSLILRHGAVSRPVAIRMAQGARKALRADYAVSITGIAGPSGATTTKPIGLAFIAVSAKDRTHVARFTFKGTRLSIKAQAAHKALEMLLAVLR